MGVRKEDIILAASVGISVASVGYSVDRIIQPSVSTPSPTSTPQHELSRQEMADELISAPLGAEKRRNYIEVITVLHNVVKEFINPQIAEKAGIGDSFFQDIVTSDDETLAKFIKTHTDLGQEGFAFFGQKQTWILLGNQDVTINSIDIFTAKTNAFDPNEQFKISPDVITANIDLWIDPQTMPDVVNAYSGTAQKAALAFNIFNLPDKMYWFPINRIAERGQENDKGIRGISIDQSSGAVITVDVGSYAVFNLSVNYPSTIHYPR